MLLNNAVKIFKNNFEEKRYYDRFEFLVQNYKAGEILDIGNIGGILGEGRSFSSYHKFKNILPKNCTLHGLDLILPKDIENYPNQKIGNLEQELPYLDKQFDTVYIGEVLEHMQNPGLALKEINRILKDDGVLILDVPNPYSLFRIIKYVCKRNEDLGDITHLIFWTPASLKAILKKTGFELLILNTKLSNKFKFIPNIFIKGLGSHLLVVAKKLNSK